MPEWISIVLLGLIEGVTEFLPVSSTGHLLVAEHWLGLKESDLFNVVIQCGAVLAVIPLFPQRINQFLFRWREPATQDYLLKIAVAFFITGAVGFVLDKKGFKLPETTLPIAIALITGGVLFVLIERMLKGRSGSQQITWPVVYAVAIGQLVAGVFPGTSRSGATILFSLLLGLSRPTATEFSFLVGIPTMLAAGGWKIFKALRHHAPDAPAENWSMVILGAVTAAIVSFFVVKWLLRFVQTHTFVAFGWYRIALGVSILIFLRTH
ncbi:MAG: undecaprenyl-diphosphate phosphatase [Verrucomicrobia bacterium]|nr:MAG: undecaprenyl-diphosphate phosphatase [Verrucomicrobiota bacterium]